MQSLDKTFKLTQYSTCDIGTFDKEKKNLETFIGIDIGWANCGFCVITVEREGQEVLNCNVLKKRGCKISFGIAKLFTNENIKNTSLITGILHKFLEWLYNRHEHLPKTFKIERQPGNQPTNRFVEGIFLGIAKGICGSENQPISSSISCISVNRIFGLPKHEYPHKKNERKKKMQRPFH